MQARECPEGQGGRREAGRVHVDTKQLVYSRQTCWRPVHAVMCRLQTMICLIPRRSAGKDELHSHTRQAQEAKSLGKYGRCARGGEQEQQRRAYGRVCEVADAVGQPCQDIQYSICVCSKNVGEIRSIQHVLECGQHFHPNMRSVLSWDETNTVKLASGIGETREPRHWSQGHVPCARRIDYQAVTYRLQKKYSRYVHIGRLGRKNCLVAGIRTRSEYPAETIRTSHSGIGAIENENAMKDTTIAYWISVSTHRCLCSARTPSSGLKDVCNAETACGGWYDAFDFCRLRPLLPLPGRILCGIGFQRANVRVPGRRWENGSFGFGAWVRNELNSYIVSWSRGRKGVVGFWRCVPPAKSSARKPPRRVARGAEDRGRGLLPRKRARLGHRIAQATCALC